MTEKAWGGSSTSLDQSLAFYMMFSKWWMKSLTDLQGVLGFLKNLSYADGDTNYYFTYIIIMHFLL